MRTGVEAKQETYYGIKARLHVVGIIRIRSALTYHDPVAWAKCRNMPTPIKAVHEKFTDIMEELSQQQRDFAFKEAIEEALFS